LVGNAIVGTSGSSDLDLGHIEPASLRPAFQSELGKLNAFDAFHQSVVPRRIRRDVSDEILPLDLETIQPKARLRLELTRRQPNAAANIAPLSVANACDRGELFNGICCSAI